MAYCFPLTVHDFFNYYSEFLPNIILICNFSKKLLFVISIICKKKKSSPITGLDRPRGFREVKAPRFRNNVTG